MCYAVHHYPSADERKVEERAGESACLKSITLQPGCIDRRRLDTGQLPPLLPFPCLHTSASHGPAH
jgi:hypothetical protein